MWISASVWMDILRNFLVSRLQYLFWTICHTAYWIRYYRRYYCRNYSILIICLWILLFLSSTSFKESFLITKYLKSRRNAGFFYWRNFSELMISVLNDVSSETVILYVFSPSVKQTKDCHDFIGLSIPGHVISNSAFARFSFLPSTVLLLFVMDFTHSSKL